MYFRNIDHQAMQSMYIFKMDIKPDREWAVPVLVRDVPQRKERLRYCEKIIKDGLGLRSLFGGKVKGIKAEDS